MIYQPNEIEDVALRELNLVNVLVDFVNNFSDYVTRYEFTIDVLEFLAVHIRGWK